MNSKVKKTIFALDLGTTSIGVAVVEENLNKDLSNIRHLAVRVNPLTVDEKINFEGGKPISTNADRTLKRGARRNLDRYQLRRENLIEILRDHNFIFKETPLTEVGKNTTHQLLFLRAKAAEDKIELKDFARVLLAINKKRGYKSSRKSKDENDGVAIDGMAVAKILYNEKMTPGQFVCNLLANDKKFIPDFYPSDLKAEFDAVWTFQKTFYPDLLTNELYKELLEKNSNQVWAICAKHFDIKGKILKGTKAEQRLQRYNFRKNGLNEKLDPEHLVIALQEINNDITNTSGYLGRISDRSKILYTDELTVGQYQYDQIVNNPHSSLKNQVFYRQDYLDEFEQIWETQSKFHKELTVELKQEIRDVVIFYQRPLKSQKGLLGHCLFESWEQEYFDELKVKKRKRTVGHRVIPKSSPLFQQFKIWQNINDLAFKYIGKGKFLLDDSHTTKVGKETIWKLDEEDRNILFKEANSRANSKGKLSNTEVFKLLGLSSKEWKSNFKEGINANTTSQKFLDIFQEIAFQEGYGHDWHIKTNVEIWQELRSVFKDIGIDTGILDFDPLLNGNSYAQQKSFELWHLLYSVGDDTNTSEEDKMRYGSQDTNLRKTIHSKFGFKPKYAKMLSNLSFSNDYGRLSSRAIRKLLPHLMNGHDYYESCDLVGYNHSNSETNEDLDNKVYKDKLELLPRNSLRNPVVEKILNQMVNVVNELMNTYGRPDEVRIELARELKKSTEERKKMTQYINSATKVNLDIAQTIKQEFGFNATKKDIVKYKLWLELLNNGHKTIFSNKEIPKGKLFSKEIDIEHIIPKALVYDDSFSNLTLAYRDVNLKKANRTGMDFMEQDHQLEVENYRNRVESLYNKGKGAILKTKRDKLLQHAVDLKGGFIERDLRNSQYIARQARKMLKEIAREVTSTTGKVTDKLREEWGIINVLKELNLPKYKALGLTEIEDRKHGKTVEENKGLV